MIQKFHNHFNDEDILKLNIDPEAEQWKRELLFNKKEIQFYRFLLVQKLLQEARLDSGNPKLLLYQLRDFREANDALYQKLLKFRNYLEGMKECDEVQCENFYLKNFLTLKESLEKHSGNFRRLKKVIFKYLYNNNVLRIDKD